MQELLVSEVIRRKRIEMGLTQEQLCEGICESFTISRIENGKQPPSRSTADALLQRLGISDSRYYFAFQNNVYENSEEDIEKEYQIFILQEKIARFCDIEREITDSDKQADLKILEELGNITCSGNHIDKQCFLIAKVSVLEKINTIVPDKINLLEEAILLTVPKFHKRNLCSGVYSYNEMNIIRKLGLAYSEAGHTKQAVELLSQLYNYITIRAKSITRPGRIISPIAHSYSLVLLQDGKPQQAFDVAECGMQNCIDYGYQGELIRLLELEAKCLISLKKTKQGKERSLEAMTLRKVIEKFSKQPEKEDWKNINQSFISKLSYNGNKNMHLGKVIKHVRENRGFSQKMLCQGLCTTATLSRFESGEQSPSWDCVRSMLERLGTGDENYTAILTAEEIELDRMKNEIMKLNVAFRKEKKEKHKETLNTVLNMLDQMETQIKKTDSINRQFIMRERTIIAEQNHSCSLDEKLNQLLEALHLTLPNLCFDNMNQFLYSHEEFSLLINIASTYYNLGQVRQAFYIYEQLYRVFYKKYFHHHLMILFTHNYAINLGNEKSYNDAIHVAADGIYIAIERKQYEILPILLHTQAECFYLLEQPEKCKEYYSYIAPLYRIFGDYQNLKTLSIDAEERFHMKF